jgi:hypothetical protein
LTSCGSASGKASFVAKNTPHLTCLEYLSLVLNCIQQDGLYCSCPQLQHLVVVVTFKIPYPSGFYDLQVKGFNMLDDANHERCNALFVEADSLVIKVTSLQSEVDKAVKMFSKGHNALSSHDYITICNEIVLHRKMILSILSEIRILRDEAQAISGYDSTSRSLFKSYDTY